MILVSQTGKGTPSRPFARFNKNADVYCQCTHAISQQGMIFLWFPSLVIIETYGYCKRQTDGAWRLHFTRGWAVEALQHYIHKSNFKAICLFALIICLPLIVLQGFQPTATGRGQRHQFHICFMWYKEHRLTNGRFKHSRREASQTCSSPSSYQNVMVCEGEMGKRDEMVKKKSVGEIQRAYYEQWQNSKVRRTNRLQHSTYDKALNLNYLNYCVLNEAQ